MRRIYKRNRGKGGRKSSFKSIYAPPVSTDDIGLSDIFSVVDEEVYIDKAMLKIYMEFNKSPEEYLADTKRFIAFAYEYTGYNNSYSQIMDLVSALKTENEGVKDTQKFGTKHY